MARQRHSFFAAMERALKVLRRWVTRLRVDRWMSGLLLVGLFLLSVGIAPVRSQLADKGQLMQGASAAQLNAQAKKAYDEGNYLSAIDSSKQAAESFKAQGDWQNQASSLSNLGISQLAVGQPEEAFKSWNTTEQIYIAHMREQKEIAERGIVQSRIYQAQALKDAGFYDRACNIFLSAIMSKSPECGDLDKSEEAKKDKITAWQRVSEALDLIKNDKNQYIKEEKIKALTWKSFGEILRAIGKLEESESILREGVKITHGKAPEDGIQLGLASTLRARGNLERDRQLPPQYSFIPWHYDARELDPTGKSEEEFEETKLKYEKAFLHYQDAIKEYENLSNSKSTIIQIQSKTNQLELLNQQLRRKRTEYETATF